MAFFDSLWGAAGNIAGSLAKVAALGYVSKLLSNNTNESSTGQPEVVDPGVRLQLTPNTENKIPVLYGEAYFGGYMTDVTISADYKKMTYCLVLSETTGQKLSDNQNSFYTFHDVYFNNNRVVFKADGYTVDYTLDPAGNQDISARDLIKVYFYRGLVPIQPSGYSGTTPAPSSVMPGWTSGTHPMSNLIYAIVEVTYSKDKGISGLPDCTFHVENSMTLPGDVLVDYMLNTRYGAGIAAGDINQTFIDLNTYCAAGFSYTAIGGSTASGPIEINGLVDTQTVVLTNMEELAKAAGSWISYDIHLGQWIVVINRAGSSIASFTDSNMIGEISISGTSLTQLNNVANVKYQNTDIQDKTDFVKISIPEGDLFANEPRSTLEITLPFTTQQVVAAKLGLQYLKQARVDKIITFKADYSYMNLRAGDLVDITSSAYGFTNKMVRLINVEEAEGETGELVLSFKGLEYDAAVYDYNIQEYAVETDDGLLGIGAIGKPNTPTVTKTEQANVPKIVINAVVPSGIVDSMEFWITFDTDVGNDASRTYIQIGAYRNTNGTTLTENQTVSYTYSGLAQSNFFVKVRGANNITSGPYSDPTGLITYVPIVVADTVSNNPVLGLDNQLMSLGLLALLNNLDGLYKGLFGTGSLLDKIIDGIKEATGVDLKDGATITETIYSDPVPCYLSLSKNRYPLDRNTYENPETPYGSKLKDLQANYTFSSTDLANYSGEFIFSGSIGDYASPTGDYHFSIQDNVTLTTGSGTVKLYKTDGTLVETINASSLVIDNVNRIVKIPFSSRTTKTDYYITMEKGVITGSNGCISPAIEDSLSWSFHTDSPSPIPKLKPPPPTAPAQPCPAVSLIKVITRLYSDRVSPDNLKTDIETNVGIYYNQSVVLQQVGTITINSSSGVHQTIDLSKTFANHKVGEEVVWVEGNTLWVNSTVDFARGTTYWITMSANCVLNSCSTSGNAAVSNSTTITWTTEQGPTTTPVLPASSGANASGATLPYDGKVSPGSGVINIKNSSGTVIKSVPATDPAVTIKEG